MKIFGHVRGFATDKNGKVKPGSLMEGNNEIWLQFRSMCAFGFWADNATYLMDDLLTASSTTPGVDSGYSANGRDGIFGFGVFPNGSLPDTLNHADLDTEVVHTTHESFSLQTVLNAGGGLTDPFIEYYGFLDGAFNQSSLQLALAHHIVVQGGTPGTNCKFDQVWAVKDGVSISIGAGEKYHVYWRLTIG